MSYFDLVASVFDWQVFWFIVTILLGGGFMAAGVVAVVIGGESIADNYGWVWNLLYVPAVIVATFFAVMFAYWLWKVA